MLARAVLSDLGRDPESGLALAVGDEALGHLEAESNFFGAAAFERAVLLERGLGLTLLFERFNQGGAGDRIARREIDGLLERGDRVESSGLLRARQRLPGRDFLAVLAVGQPLLELLDQHLGAGFLAVAGLEVLPPGLALIGPAARGVVEQLPQHGRGLAGVAGVDPGARSLGDELVASVALGLADRLVVRLVRLRVLARGSGRSRDADDRGDVLGLEVGELLGELERAVAQRRSVGELVGAVEVTLRFFGVTRGRGGQGIDRVRPRVGLLECVDAHVEHAALPFAGLASQLGEAVRGGAAVTLEQLALGTKDLQGHVAGRAIGGVLNPVDEASATERLLERTPLLVVERVGPQLPRSAGRPACRRRVPSRSSTRPAARPGPVPRGRTSSRASREARAGKSRRGVDSRSSGTGDSLAGAGVGAGLGIGEPDWGTRDVDDRFHQELPGTGARSAGEPWG